MDKEFKVYFSPIGSRDPYNVKDKTFGSAISVFKEVKPDVAIFLFSKEMSERRDLFFRILQGAIDEIKKEDKEYECEVIRPDDSKHKNLIESDELSMDFDGCFKKYIPIVNEYYDEYDERMDEFIINISSGQPQQKIAYCMMGFMEGRNKIRAYSASYDPSGNSKEGRQRKNQNNNDTSYEVVEQTVSYYIWLNKLYTTRRLVNENCFAAALELWEKDENGKPFPYLVSKLKYLNELLDSVNGKHIRKLMNKKNDFYVLKRIPKISDEKIFTCYAYLLSCQLYLEKKDYRAMIASLTPLFELSMDRERFDEETQSLIFTLLDSAYLNAKGLKSFDDVSNILNVMDSEERTILLKFRLLNGLVDSSRRNSDNLRNSIVAHNGYKRIEDKDIQKAINNEIDEMKREVRYDKRSDEIDKIAPKSPYDGSSILSLAWDIFDYITKKRNENPYPRLEDLKKEIKRTLEESIKGCDKLQKNEDDVKKTKKNVVYYSFISDADIDEKTKKLKEGPFKRILNKDDFHPDVIAVQYSEKTECVIEEIEAYCNDNKIKLFKNKVGNVADFDEMLESTRDFLFNDELSIEGSEVICNVSSGTVQSKCALVYLKASGILPHLRFFECVSQKSPKSFPVEPLDYSRLSYQSKVVKMNFCTYKTIDQTFFIPRLLEKGRFEEARLLIGKEEYSKLSDDLDCLCDLLKGKQTKQISKTDYWSEFNRLYGPNGKDRCMFEDKVGPKWTQFAGYLLYHEQLNLEGVYNIHVILFVNVIDVLTKLYIPVYKMDKDGKEYKEYLKQNDSELYGFLNPILEDYKDRHLYAHYARNNKSKDLPDYKWLLSEVETKIEEKTGRKFPRLVSVIESINNRIETIKRTGKED